MARARKLSFEQQKAFYGMCMMLMDGKSTDEILDLADEFANVALECITQNKGITDFNEYPGIAVQISHSVENEMRDYIEFNLKGDVDAD